MIERDKPRRREDKNSVTEKHIQTIMAAIIIGLITWVGVSVTGNAELLATLTERSFHQGTQIEEMRTQLQEATKNRFTRADADRELGVINRRLTVLENE